MKLIEQIKINANQNEQDLLNVLAKKAKIPLQGIKNYQILKMGIDARKKPKVFFVYNVAIEVDKKYQQKLSGFADVVVDKSGLCYPKLNRQDLRPVVVGFGPSGMFCALALALAGLNPIVLEQGKDVDSRQKDVEDFWQNGNLNENSNVQFGEGGAGTFSDGKLNTTLNNEYCKKVICEFILNGAPDEIFYKNKAHIGTDNLRKIVKNIRQKIINNGGKIIFNAKMTNFDVQNAQIKNVQYLDVLSGKSHAIYTNCLILAIGHSAYETFKLLKYKNVNMHKKPFAMGVRIEQSQKIINLAQYGSFNPNLPSADYKLVEHLPNGRSVFTFCMCPGGRVVASSSEKGTIVTNGMSNFLRDEKNANSALLVNVTPNDFEGEDVLSGFEMQRKYEKKAFELAGKNYNAPATTVGKFLDKVDNDMQISSSYMPGLTMCDISKCLPDFVVDSLKQALVLFDKKIEGFAKPENLLIAPETRSSCPVQFDRDENFVCSINGLYACGEGAGYAGGIVSSAVDGIKCAEKIMANKN